MAPVKLTSEDVELDRLWRDRFGEPLPMLGCSDIVRRILECAPQSSPQSSTGSGSTD